MKISAVIITFNEEANIARAINSLDWADEIVVVDSESTDSTREIARSMNATVYVQPWLGFSRQKQLGVEKSSNEWIFSIDADEEVSSELKEEIRTLKESLEAKNADGFKIPRLSFYMNRPIRHGGWYPDWQIRLFNRSKGKWKDVLVHESVEMANDASVRKLRSDLFHFSVENAAHHHKMIGERYAPLSAAQMLEKGIRSSRFKIATSGIVAFFRSFFLKLGFLDGLAGFAIASFAAHHAFLKHLMLWEMDNAKSGKDVIQ